MKNIGIAIGGGIVVLLAGVLMGSLQLTPKESVRVYPVKFVCGIMPNSLSMAGVNPDFVWSVNPGRYTTSINIQNAAATSTAIVKKIMLAPREGHSATASTTINMILPARSATAADCPDIYLNMGVHASSTVYMEGFLDIVSTSDLYITAVYTGQGIDANGSTTQMSTMDIERVPAEAVPK